MLTTVDFSDVFSIPCGSHEASSAAKDAAQSPVAAEVFGVHTEFANLVKGSSHLKTALRHVQSAAAERYPRVPLTTAKTRMIFVVKQLARNNLLKKYFQLMEERFAANVLKGDAIPGLVEFRRVHNLMKFNVR